MTKLIPLLRVYFAALAYCARIFTIGCLSRADRTGMKLICDLAGKRIRPAEQLLPEVGIDDLVPMARQIRMEKADCNQNGGLGLFDLFVIDTLCDFFRPRRIFEFGTFQGRTTLNLAANSPEDAKIFTLDLPREKIEAAQFAVLDGENAFVQNLEAPRLFAGTPYAGKVVQLFGDSSTFDYSPYLNSMDFIFIVIVWDDYDAWYEGLTNAVGLLYKTEPAFRGAKKIRGTSFAYLQL